METKRYFLTHFLHPRFASGYDQNHLIITEVSKENKHRVVAKLMNIAVEINETTGEKSKGLFTNYWTRITA